MVFCYFALQNSQIAISTPLFCYFLQKWHFQLWLFAIALSRTAKWQRYSFQMLNTQSKIGASVMHQFTSSTEGILEGFQPPTEAR